MSAAIDYSIRQAEKHNKRGDINTAKAVIEKAIQKYPDNPRLRLAARRLDKKATRLCVRAILWHLRHLRSVSIYFKQSSGLLIKKCSEIIEDDADIPSVWNFLGIAQRFAGFPMLAEISHRKAWIQIQIFVRALAIWKYLKDLKKFSEAEDAHLKAAKIELKIRAS